LPVAVVDSQEVTMIEVDAAAVLAVAVEKRTRKRQDFKKSSSS